MTSDTDGRDERSQLMSYCIQHVILVSAYAPPDFGSRSDSAPLAAPSSFMHTIFSSPELMTLVARGFEQAALHPPTGITAFRLINHTCSNAGLVLLFHRLDFTSQYDLLEGTGRQMANRIHDLLSLITCNKRIPKLVGTLTIACALKPPCETAAELAPDWLSSADFRELVLLLVKANTTHTININPGLANGGTDGGTLVALFRPLLSNITTLRMTNIVNFPLAVFKDMTRIKHLELVRVEYLRTAAQAAFPVAPECLRYYAAESVTDDPFLNLLDGTGINSLSCGTCNPCDSRVMTSIVPTASQSLVRLSVDFTSLTCRLEPCLLETGLNLPSLHLPRLEEITIALYVRNYSTPFAMSDRCPTTFVTTFLDSIWARRMVTVQLDCLLRGGWQAFDWAGIDHSLVSLCQERTDGHGVAILLRYNSSSTSRTLAIEPDLDNDRTFFTQHFPLCSGHRTASFAGARPGDVVHEGWDEG
ncbi:hypothetical protein BKA70DRAFT_1447159 [Coprinopsis sp. MPI-PUGE-AT-0042]|nr:hypothetical protein BKA70DRAFT_1447159 [Coprinopsis sp. MPI-PUGE-AT-0042]